MIVWSANGILLPNIKNIDNGIAFKTPKFNEESSNENVSQISMNFLSMFLSMLSLTFQAKVYIVLRRPTDGAISNIQIFVYKRNDITLDENVDGMLKCKFDYDDTELVALKELKIS